MVQTNALVKLTKCMENFFRESPEARSAMREWLDQMDRQEEQQKTKIIAVPRQQSNKTKNNNQKAKAKPPPAPAAPFELCGKRAHFPQDPTAFKWKFLGVENNSLAIYERELPSCGLITLRYFFTTGSVQMVYQRDHCPHYMDGSSDKKSGSGKKMAQENFRPSEAQFLNMLENPPNMFGKGYLNSPTKKPK